MNTDPNSNNNQNAPTMQEINGFIEANCLTRKRVDFVYKKFNDTIHKHNLVPDTHRFKHANYLMTKFMVSAMSNLIENKLVEEAPELLHWYNPEIVDTDTFNNILDSYLEFLESPSLMSATLESMMLVRRLYENEIARNKISLR